MNRQIY
jgi:hypothetical protein